MEINKSTFAYMAAIAVENYENEVAYKQGVLAHSVYNGLKIRRTFLGNWIRGFWSYPFEHLTYTDVLEWIERCELPDVVQRYNRRLYRETIELVYETKFLDGHMMYNMAKKFLRDEADSDNKTYNVESGLYKWLQNRQLT